MYDKFDLYKRNPKDNTILWQNAGNGFGSLNGKMVIAHAILLKHSAVR